MGASAKRTGELIDKGINIVTSDNGKVTINYLISDQGGQGDVYHASYMGNDYALKWYCKNPSDVIGGQQYDTIRVICGNEKKPSDKFIWPLFLVTEENPCNGKRFGYLMNLLPSGYYEMSDFLRMDSDDKAVRFHSYNAMLVAGMNIAYAMRKLHLRGYSYKDLNPKNFALDPETGDALVIDNDNVSYDGAPCTVLGMKGYMAPEICRSRYAISPSLETDYYSLAVVLYQLFFVDHPMDGALWAKVAVCTEKIETYLYSIKPVFHFDPNNDSNRPTDVYAPNAIRRWKVMPQEIRALFINAFTAGIDDPGKRSPEGEWIGAIAKCRDKLIRLRPGREQFINYDDINSIPPRCLTIKIGGHRVALYPHKAIYQISIDNNYHKYGNITAGITYDPKIDSLMIRNMTENVWRGYSPKTQVLSDIHGGQDYPIAPGTMIEFHKENPRIIGEISDPRE